MHSRLTPRFRGWPNSVRSTTRALIALTFAIGVWLSWLVQTARTQRIAVEAIRRAGGSVKYDRAWSGGPNIPERKAWAPPWLVNFVGVDYFGTVVAVNLSRDFGDAMWDGCSDRSPVHSAMVHVGYLSGLRELNLDTSCVTNADLEHLRGLRKLAELDLELTAVTDVGLKKLEGLANLSYLSLSGSEVTDAGCGRLGNLHSLSQLSIANTTITDNGLARLGGLTNMSGLNLSGTQITDASVERLVTFTKLKLLLLGNTKITDAGVSELKARCQIWSFIIDHPEL